jgi:hypothetical protein
MRIFKPKPPEPLVRLCITKTGEDAEYLTLCETTKEEVKTFIEDLIRRQNLSIFEKGKVTSVNIRNALGKANLDGTTVSFRGLTPKEVKALVEKSLSK